MNTAVAGFVVLTVSTVVGASHFRTALRASALFLALLAIVPYSRAFPVVPIAVLRHLQSLRILNDFLQTRLMVGKTPIFIHLPARSRGQ